MILGILLGESYIGIRVLVDLSMCIKYTNKHALGEASCSGLTPFAIACGANEPEIDLFTSANLYGCHLIRTKEER